MRAFVRGLMSVVMGLGGLQGIASAQSVSPAAAQAGPAQPLFFYLYVSVSDHVNLDVTEERLHRVLPMIERFRNAHPDEHVSATVFFSGAASRALDERNATTHIKDFILGYKKRGVIEVGYDGTDEPTYDRRPIADFPQMSTPEERRQARLKADEKFLNERRDPLTGEAQPGMGGLAEMQHVFGQAAYIRGASAPVTVIKPYVSPQPGMSAVLVPTKVPLPEVGDWELVSLLPKYNPTAVLAGMPELNMAGLPGFRGAVRDISRLLSPEANSAPELYWEDNVLRNSDWAGGVIPVTRVLRANEGPDGLKDAVAKIDRTRVHIVHLELASEKDYLTPEFLKSPTPATAYSAAVAYAYAHPQSPKLPASARVSAAEVNAAYAKEEAGLKWIADSYLPSNGGSRFVGNSDFRRMVLPAAGFSVSTSELQTALRKMLQEWGNDTFPPNYLAVEGHYLSLADMFQVMTDELAQLNATGKLPASVRVTSVHGPSDMPIGHGPNAGELSVASIAKKCAELAPGLHDESGGTAMKNVLPPGVVVDGIGVNSAQFLRLMAKAMVNPQPDAKFQIRMTYMTPGLTELFPRTRLINDTGATWTMKPALLDVRVPAVQASR